MNSFFEYTSTERSKYRYSVWIFFVLIILSGGGGMKRSSFMQTFLVIVLLVSFVSCGENGEPIATEDQEVIEETTTTKPVETSNITPDEKKEPEEYLSFNWKSFDSNKSKKYIKMNSNETKDIIYKITNISKSLLTIRLDEMQYDKNSIDYPRLIPENFTLGVGETKEIKLSVYCSEIDNKITYYGVARCRLKSNDAEMSKYMNSSLNLIVERTDIQNYPIVWQTEFFQGRYSLDFNIINDTILCASGEIWPFFSGYTIFAYDLATGKLLWDTRDYSRIINTYNIKDKKLFCHLDSFEVTYDDGNSTKTNHDRTYYSMDIKTGEIIDNTEEETRLDVSNNKSHHYLEYSSNGNLILRDSTTREIILEIKGFFIDYHILNNSILVLEADDGNYLDLKYYLKKYAFDGELLAIKEVPKFGIIIIHDDYLFYEGGREEEYDIAYDRSEFTHDYSLLNVEDISLIDFNTLNILWTHDVGSEKDSSTLQWRKWFFRNDKILVQSDDIFFGIDIESGEIIWKIEDFSPFGNISDSMIEDESLIIESKNPDTLFGSYYLFIDIETGEITETKIENFSINRGKFSGDMYRRKISNDGYIIRQYLWLDPETYEILGINVGLDGETFEPILEIRDGLMYYISRGIDKKYYLVCKKIVDTKDVELASEE